MASKQLMASLTANLKNSLNRKQKIVFNENKLDSHILSDVKLGLDTNNTKRAVEMIFRILAVAELAKKQSLYKFASYEDVKQRINNIYQANIYTFAHILLRDLLIGKIYVERFRFACSDISSQIFQELSKSIE